MTRATSGRRFRFRLALLLLVVTLLAMLLGWQRAVWEEQAHQRAIRRMNIETYISQLEYGEKVYRDPASQKYYAEQLDKLRAERDALQAGWVTIRE